MATYIYARVSTMEQYVTGYSIEGQCASCLRFCEQQGLALGEATNSGRAGIFVDGGKSAFKKKLNARAGGQGLLAALKPGDTVVATATHRLFRRMADMASTLEHWIEKGISVRFIDYPMLSTNTANGKAMLYIFAALAQMKSELISARVKESHEFAKLKKLRIAPICQEEDPVVVVLPETLQENLGAILQEAVRSKGSKRTDVGQIRGYIRVSTKEQTVGQQRIAIEKNLPPDLAGKPIKWYEDEGESAYRKSMKKRRSGSILMADLQPGDIVVAWRTDRMFRSLLDMARTIEQIHKAGAYLLIVEGDIRTDTQMGNMLVSMISVMAEIESQDISRSVKMGIFASLATSEKMQRRMLPKMFRGYGNAWCQKHFGFTELFTNEDRLNMYYQLYLTHKQYSDRRTACRVISNQWLNRKGLPHVEGEIGDSIGRYLARLKAMQREEFSMRRAEAIADLESMSRDKMVTYPICVSTIAEMWPVICRFLASAKKTKGRLRDKMVTTAVIGSAVDPAVMVKVVELLK
jgi:DNA invertase Pin-like site-specific DNA recombinase